MRKTLAVVLLAALCLLAAPPRANANGTPNPCDGALSLKLLDAPCRFVDTRQGYGFSGPYGPPSLTSARVFDFDATPGAGQQPGGACSVPVGAKAVMFVITADDRGDTSGITGSVSCYPTGHAPFINSALNFAPGKQTSNTVTIALNGDGRLSCFAQYVPATNVVFDLLGYYVANCGCSGDDH